MKGKIFVFAAFFFLALAEVFSDSETSEILIPKKIYVGDTAELRFTFRSSIELFEDSPGTDEKNIPLSNLPFDSDNSDFTLSGLTLQKNGFFYTVVFTFIPWRTGFVDIPSFDLLSLSGKNSAVPLLIDPNPVEVSSVLSNSEENEIRPPFSPLLVPGTVYFVWGIIILCVILFVILAVLIAKRKDISGFFKRKMVQLSYAKNARRALRELKRLETKSGKFSDKEFAFLYQKIFRKYFSGRLGISFESVVSRDFPKAFLEATGGFMSEDRTEKSEEITGIFFRTDYIRFAEGSLESERFPSSENSASFQDGERKRILEKGREVIFSFENNKRPKEKDLSAKKSNANDLNGEKNA